MAQLTVLFFSYAQDRMNGRQKLFTVAEGMTIRDFYQATLAEPLGEPLDRLLFSVNTEWASPDRVLQDGDHLAVIPPVSGG